MQLVRGTDPCLFDGRYAFEKTLHSGGMGQVFRARDTLYGDTVVVKSVFRGRPHFIEYLDGERFILERLRHPSIVRLRTNGSFDGMDYLVLEDLGDFSARDGLETQGYLTPREAAAFMDGTLRALTAVHQAGIVHRDIKPENVLFVPGKGAMLIDFGLAMILRPSSRWKRFIEPEVVCGTPAYIAPEYICNQKSLDHRADLYGCGAMLYELLAGRPPFIEATVHWTLEAHLHLQPPPLSGVAPALAGVVMRALRKKPAERFQTADEMRRALGAALARL